MKVALIGASGFVGKAVLNELLQRGHQVIAIARNAESIEPQSGLTVAAIDATDADALSEAVKGSDIVISAFNAGWTNPNLYAEFLSGSKAIQTGVKKSVVKRLLVVGGAGSLFIDGKQLVDSPQFPAEFKPGASAARDYQNELKNETGLDWTFISPPMEMHPGTSGIRTGAYRLGKDSPVFAQDGRCYIAVEDLAVAIVDEVEQPKHSRERFTVGY